MSTVWDDERAPQASRTEGTVRAERSSAPKVCQVRNPLWQRGDTIVEVLIALAIISLVLTGAYGVTQKSSFATRDSQEHAQAEQLVEGQLESLRALAYANPVVHDPFAQLGNFCITAGNTIASAPCMLNSGGATPAASELGYKLTVTKAGCSPETAGCPATFTAAASWDNLAGGTDNVSMLYRLYRSGP